MIRPRGSWVATNDSGGGYWDVVFSPRPVGLQPRTKVVVIRVKGKFYVSPNSGSFPSECDIGPYGTLEEAAVVAETVEELRAWPESWRVSENYR